MMVNLVYFYDIISTMYKTTVNQSWTIRPGPDSKHNSKLEPFTVASVYIPDLASHQMIISQYTLGITSDRFNRLVSRGCPIKLLILLMNSMMNIPATINKDYFGKFSVFVNTFFHMTRHIDEAIQKMIDRSFFTDLSFDDAREIISRLKLEEFIYCFEGHELGVCLVVLGPNVRKQNQYEQPWYLFQQEVQKFNVSRTIFMTPEQEERLIKCNEVYKESVEFTSAIDKTTRRVVFKRENQRIIDIIKQMILVEKLEKEHSEAKIKLEEMKELESILDLQKRMFPQ